jgi:hypothetical protein
MKSSRVALRIRPPNPRREQPSTQQLRGAFGEFRFDAILDQTYTQQEIYQVTAEPLVKQFLKVGTRST